MIQGSFLPSRIFETRSCQSFPGVPIFCWATFYVSVPHFLDALGGDNVLFRSELAHEVSIRSTYNRMDAHNLALVLAPNLVKGSNFKRDFEMCAVPNPVDGQTAKSQSATLGLVIKTCIPHYYEIFDEVVDRTEAIPPQLSSSSFTVVDSNDLASASASFSSDVSGTQVDGDDESIDDQMLVMPLGPTPQGSPNNIPSGPTPPSAWSSQTTTPLPYKPRQRTALSKTSNQSLHTTTGVSGTGVGGNMQGTVGRAKSMISVEKGTAGGGPGGRKGSISIGRGTTRKSTGSGVEAVGITANGFFTPPESSPPVPLRRR
jgi:Rho GTPase-activating protein 1